MNILLGGALILLALVSFVYIYYVLKLQKNFNKNFNKVLALIATQSLLVIGITSYYMNQTLPWYNSLKHSSLQPPSWVFTTVWSYIYFSWFLALYLVYKEQKKTNELLLKQFVVNFVSNITLQFFWVLRFADKKIGAGAILLVLGAAIVASGLAYSAYKIKKYIGYILLPQAIWLFIATFLAVQTYLLNR